MYSSSMFFSIMFVSPMVVVMLQMLLLETAVAQVEVSVSPAQIDVGSSPSLDLNCTFSLTATGMAGIISLTLSRENNTELASITSLADHQANVISSEGVTADGVINPGGQSYIHLHWDYPTDTQNGTYLCIARGIDILGHSIETINTSVVTVNQPDIQDLMKELKQMKQIQTTLVQEMQEMQTKMEDQLDAPSLFLLPPLSYNNKQYFVSKGQFLDVNETITICKAYGGILAEVNDLDEYHAIQDYVSTLSGVNILFIGGTDEGHEGTWVLPSSGKELPVTDWYVPNPNDAETNNCLSLNRGAQWWKMFYYYCHFDRSHEDHRYMCEI